MDAQATAVVTGAAAGIGAAIAARLCADGYAVAVLDVAIDGAREHAARLVAGGGTALAFEVDVSEASAVESVFAEVASSMPPIEALVNDAGIIGPYSPFAEYDMAAWRRVLEVDLFGVVNCCKSVLPLMTTAIAGSERLGRIVNIASISGKEGNANMTAYAAAKAGAIGFTKAFGKEVGPQGILVNAVAPAGVSGTTVTSGDTSAFTTVPSMPMGRNAQPAEVAALVSWLCSPECTFNAGAVFDISGGRATY